MKAVFPPRPARSGKNRAAALVIVLAFVVLLTGLVLAFFSRTLLDRQISNSSASQARVDLFTQGAVDTIVADIQQEIVAGSTVTQLPTPTPPATPYPDQPTKIYTPKVPATAVVAQVGLPVSSTGYENLLKRSARGVAFYPSTNYDANASNRAAAVSTLAPSVNGRVISPARWNKHLLLQKQSFATNGAADTNDTDFTPVGATAAAGATAASWASAPDWILVDRNGSNPTAGYNANMAASATSPTSVVGRFAYAMYDEGGLLDMNVAGYPSVMSSQQASGKNSLAYADLRQLPGLAGLSSTRQDAIINALIGWRDGASVSTDFSQPTPAPASSPLVGPFPTYNWLASSIPSYATNYASLLGNTTGGFLKTSNPLVIAGQTDRLFSSRQELLKLLLQGAATSGSNGAGERASLQASLEYLGTFSRALQQPSYVPPINNPNISNPPKTDATATGSNSVAGNDALINPSFLNVRVLSTIAAGRNDGSNLTIGEPLVKKRFALNRLAWLTYKGPIADKVYTGGTTVNADADIQKYAQQLHDLYGLSWQFLQQGTAANIYRYFGVSWVTDTRTTPQGDNQKKWVYDHSKVNPTSGTASPVTTLGSGGPILRLGRPLSVTTPDSTRYVQDLGTGREPDLVELLKAATAAGSKGKAATLIANGTNLDSNGSVVGSGSPDDVQNRIDTSFDIAVIQMLANLIDQYDLDGYSTRIIFNDGSLLPKEIMGIESAPYFYGLRTGYVQGRQPVYTPGTYSTGNALPFTAPGSVGDTGYMVVMQFPEVWNPHDQNSPRCATDATGAYLTDSSGKPLFPTSFRLVADSIDPDHISPTGANYQTVRAETFNNNPGGYYDANSSNGNYPGAWSTPATPAAYGNASPFASCAQMQALPFAVFAENTALNFTIDETAAAAAAGYFREPTSLCSPTVAGGTLRAGGTANMLNPTVSIANTVPSNHANLKPLLDSSGAVISTDSSSSKYLGIYFATLPMAYFNKEGGAIGNGYFDTGPSTYKGITYRMQCEYPAGSGSWRTYDSKFALMTNRGSVVTTSTPKALSQPKGQITPGQQGSLLYNRGYDPRSNRFSVPYGGGGNTNAPSGSGPTALTPAAWLDLTAMTLVSERPDYSSGYFLAMLAPGQSSNDAARQLPLATGWAVSFGTSQSAPAFGLLAQNNPAYTANGKIYAGGTTTLQPTTGYYADPDGVVRRGMGAYVTTGTTSSIGLPFATSNTYSSGTAISTSQAQSRPIMLNRPFQTVAELGAVFSGTPWKGLDFFTPESGDAPLLDVLAINDTDDTNGMLAGKVDLNTRQTPVLQAILSGAYKDEQARYVSGKPSWTVASMTTTEAPAVASALVARTTNTASATNKGPLANVSELVGRYVTQGYTDPFAASGATYSYDGFSNDLTTPFVAGTVSSNIQRLREAPIRALAANGQTRVWNLLIDIIAQSGRYPATANALNNFVVEGEQRYWVHVAIDRCTGQVIDKQIEVVKE